MGGGGIFYFFAAVEKNSGNYRTGEERVLKGSWKLAKKQRQLVLQHTLLLFLFLFYLRVNFASSRSYPLFCLSRSDWKPFENGSGMDRMRWMLWFSLLATVCFVCCTSTHTCTQTQSADWVSGTCGNLPPLILRWWCRKQYSLLNSQSAAQPVVKNPLLFPIVIEKKKIAILAIMAGTGLISTFK